MKGPLTIALRCGVLLSLATMARADGGALGARAGSQGLGIEALGRIAPGVHIRGGLNLLTFSLERQEQQILYRGTLKLRSTAALLDLHPGEGDFHLSAGLVYDKNEAEGTAHPASPIMVINGVPYPVFLVGTLKAQAAADRKWAPYVGLGFGNVLRPGRRLGFSLELGVIFQGQPVVHLTADGPAAVLPPFQANLAAEEAAINATIDKPLYRYYPVVSIGLAYQF